MQNSHSEPPFPKLRTSRTPYRSYANYAGKYDANEKIFRLHKTEKGLNDLAFRRNAVSGKLLLKRKKLMKMQHSVKTMTGLAAMPARAALLVNRTSESPDAATGGFQYYREMSGKTIHYGAKAGKPVVRAVGKPLRAVGRKAGNAVRQGARQAGRTIKTAAKATKAGAKVSEASAEMSAKTSVKLAKASIAAAKAAAKAVVAAVKQIAAVIASGGTAAVVMVTVLCVLLLATMIFFSPFGNTEEDSARLSEIIEQTETEYWQEVQNLANGATIQWENADPVVYFTVRNPREIYALAYVTGDSESVMDRIRTMIYTFYPYRSDVSDDGDVSIILKQRSWQEVAEEYHLDDTSFDYIRMMLSPDFDEAWFQVYHRLSVIPPEKLILSGGTLTMPNLTVTGISSPYGARGGSFHHGIDLLCSWHSEVLAVADGTVYAVNTETNDGLGNNIVLQHTAEDGTVFYTVYGHLSAVYAQIGQTVSPGAILGLEGGDPKIDPNPGASTGHHLHFEVRTAPIQSSAVDPYPYLYGTEENTSSDAA